MRGETYPDVDEGVAMEKAVSAPQSFNVAVRPANTERKMEASKGEQARPIHRGVVIQISDEDPECAMVRAMNRAREVLGVRDLIARILPNS